KDHRQHATNLPESPFPASPQYWLQIWLQIGTRRKAPKSKLAKLISPTPVQFSGAMKLKVIVISVALLLLGWLVIRRSPEPVPAHPDTPPAEDIAPAARTPAISTAKTTNTPSPISEKRPGTNFLAGLMKGEELPVKLEQLATYLHVNHRNAESLLA